MVDQPASRVEDEAGPAPLDVFVAGLTSCVATYATHYLRKHHVDAEGLIVSAWYHTGGRPNRITDVRIEVTVPPQVPRARRAALLATARHCTAHHTLQQAPFIEIVEAVQNLLPADTTSGIASASD
jgi:uncharacterized OsmC-like protein